LFIETFKLFIINNKQAGCNVNHLLLKMDFTRNKNTGRGNKFTVVIYAFFFIVILPCTLRGQDDNFVPSGEISVGLFKEGRYKEALEHFEALINKYPADPLYKYYAGASIVESGGDFNLAADLLKTAINESRSIRPVPADSWYYRGRANQLAGNFDEAIICYDRFRESVRRKELKAYNIEALIEECVALNSGDDASKYPVPDSVPDRPVSDTLAFETAVLPEQINDSVAVNLAEVSGPVDIEKVTEDYDIIAGMALEYQFRADSLSRLANRYRSTVKSLTGQDREAISRKILELESMTFEYQSLADKKLAEAAKYNRVLYDGEEELPVIAEKTEEKTLLDSAVLDIPDTVVIDKKVDSLKIRKPVLLLFDDNYPQPETIPVNDSLPAGLFYRIQTAAFRNPVNPSYFKSLGPVYGLRADESDITFYSIGYFRKKEDAEKALIKVRAAGFRDAFVIAQIDGKRISFERSEALEKEWSGRSLFEPDLFTRVEKPDEPFTLIFRVEVTSSEKELEPDKVEALRLVAGDRDFIILKNEKGEFAYLIGKFLTFDSALSYSDLLYRNGMKEARVAAYLGVKEIPVDKARELFDINYKK
jgi:tetratricopeptide (TPR) repeat protein